MNAESLSTLNELELDALTELVNLGVSKAALSLREMVGEQVLLSVPSVDLIPRKRAIETLGKNEPNKLIAVHQVFDGDIHGRALLIFPETRSLELVRAVTSGNLPLEDILELEQEALAETGNIILNGCLATIANLLQRTLTISLPEILRGDSLALFSLPPPPEAGDFVLFVYINFSVRERDIQGYIALLMDLPSLEALKSFAGRIHPENSGRRAATLECLTRAKKICRGPCSMRWTWASRFSTAIAEWSRGTRGWRPRRPFHARRRSAGGSRICSRNGSVKQLALAVTASLESGTSRLLSQSLHPALLPLKTRSGQDMIHDVTVRAIDYPPTRYCLIQVFDVSVAVKRERLLRERQNARYDAVVDSAPDVILTLDDEDTIQFANPAADTAVRLCGERTDRSAGCLAFRGSRGLERDSARGPQRRRRAPACRSDCSAQGWLGELS